MFYKKTGEAMKILHILNDGPDEFSGRIIDAQSASDEVTVVDLSEGNISYELLVDAIFSCDRVISW